MKRAQPNEHHLRLRSLVGEWEGNELLTATTSMSGGRAVGRYAIRTGLDGFFLVLDYVQRMGGAVTMRGHGVIGWDAAAKSYTLHWFDTFGHPPAQPGRATWDGDTLAFEHRYPKMLARTTFTIDHDTLIFKAETKAEGEDWRPIDQAIYHRVGLVPSILQETQSSHTEPRHR